MLSATAAAAAADGSNPKAKKVIQRIDVELPGDTTAPRVARGLVDRFAGLLPDDKARTDLHLLVSEVVTNGLRHGKQGAPIRFGVRADSDAVRVEVDNASSGGVPEQRAPGARQGGGGFGLFLLESLARRWGYETGDRTLVWFEFP